MVGSANMDLVARLVRAPRLGETAVGHSFETFPGGKGANQAVAIGKLGGWVASDVTEKQQGVTRSATSRPGTPEGEREKGGGG